MDVYIGFDSAWADNPKAPGAICAVGIEEGGTVQIHQPRLVSFDEALRFIRDVRSDKGNTLVALDQPTVVPNLTGSGQWNTLPAPSSAGSAAACSRPTGGN